MHVIASALHAGLGHVAWFAAGIGTVLAVGFAIGRVAPWRSRRHDAVEGRDARADAVPDGRPGTTNDVLEGRDDLADEGSETPP